MGLKELLYRLWASGDLLCLSYGQKPPNSTYCEHDTCITPCSDENHLMDTVIRILVMIRDHIRAYAVEKPWLDQLPPNTVRVYLDVDEVTTLRRALYIVSSLARQLGDEATRVHADSLAKMTKGTALPGRPSDWIYALDRIVDRALELQARLAART